MKDDLEVIKLLIKELGGYSRVAELIDSKPQNVYNWTKRGMPPEFVNAVCRYSKRYTPEDIKPLVFKGMIYKED